MEERGVRWIWLLLPFAAAPLVSVAGYRAGKAKAAQLAVRKVPPRFAPKVEHYILVHVSGAVKNPRVVRLRSSARVKEAIQAAGGPQAEANLDVLNLAAFVKDGQKVEVPRKAPVTAEPVRPPKPASFREKVHPTGRVQQAIPVRRLEELVRRLERLLEGREAPPVSPSRPVDINLASAEELDLLPGVGPSLAGAIIEHRKKKGPFWSVDELLEVPGIGPKTLERLRPLLVVRPETGPSAKPSQKTFPMNVNLASEEELTRIPGVGPSLAKAIVHWRSSHGPFRSVRELKEVPGIGPKTLKRIEPFVAAECPERPLNLLTASLEEIGALPGISVDLAWEIVRLRAEGRLKNLEALLTIEGFSKELLQRLKGWLSVEPLKDKGGKTPPLSEHPLEGRSETSTAPHPHHPASLCDASP